MSYWAQGSIETALRRMRPLLPSTQSWRIEVEGIMHLTGYLVHPLMMTIILLSIPMSFSRKWAALGIPWLMITATGPPFMYAVAQGAGEDEWRQRLRFLQILVVMGMGLSLSSSAAALLNLLSSGGHMLRIRTMGHC